MKGMLTRVKFIVSWYFDFEMNHQKWIIMCTFISKWIMCRFVNWFRDEQWPQGDERRAIKPHQQVYWWLHVSISISKQIIILILILISKWTTTAGRWTGCWRHPRATVVMLTNSIVMLTNSIEVLTFSIVAMTDSITVLTITTAGRWTEGWRVP
jgi:hypothetical protein